MLEQGLACKALASVSSVSNSSPPAELVSCTSSLQAAAYPPTHAPCTSLHTSRGSIFSSAYPFYCLAIAPSFRKLGMISCSNWSVPCPQGICPVPLTDHTNHNAGVRLMASVSDPPLHCATLSHPFFGFSIPKKNLLGK